MTRKYSKFVALVAGTITAVVAAWKMAGWERVPGYLSLGDVAYLWTAVDERTLFPVFSIPVGKSLATSLL